MIRRFASLVLVTVVTSAPVVAQSAAIAYPATRTVDVTDRFGTVTVADPYRWLEELNAPETGQWVAAENAVTNAYLATLPMREPLKARITELWNYPKVTPPQYEGGHWFYSRNTGLQRQPVIYMRATLDGPESVVLDPNSLSPGRSVGG